MSEKWYPDDLVEEQRRWLFDLIYDKAPLLRDIYQQCRDNGCTTPADYDAYFNLMVLSHLSDTDHKQLKHELRWVEQANALVLTFGNYVKAKSEAESA